GQPGPASVEPHATLEGRKIHLKPSGATFEIPERWLKWYASDKNNLHLSRAELEKVKVAEGEWDKEYAEVVNAVLPFSKCAVHAGGEGWGRHGVSYADLQMRAYVVVMTPEQVQEKLSKDGVARASKFSKDVSVAQSRHGDWRRGTVSYSLWYRDYGGTAKVDVYARAFGKQAAVLVFMHTDHKISDTDSVQEILKSFTWQPAK
ncbi:MAG TPA: hypothetical protein VKD71_04760, partial [Gemmataceae bacterium]|nr:hypothetical protein [Gemmataceae bacterium]